MSVPTKPKPLKDRYERWRTLPDPNATYRAHDKVPVICDCGTVWEVVKHALTSGRSTNCGCGRTEHLRNAAIPETSDLAPDRDPEVKPGSQHGWWTSLTWPYASPDYRDRVALVRCQCGTEKAVNVYDLLADSGSKSCGCLKSEIHRARLTAN